MNNVMTFPVERTSARKAGAPGIEAAIVLFPGVRIERHPFDLADRIGDDELPKPAKISKE